MAWQLKRQEEVPEPIVEEPLYQAPVESPEEEIDYNSMTKKELVSFCRENNYEIKGNWSKQKIIKFITG